MSEIKIWWSEKLANTDAKSFQQFVQLMANRLLQGDARYGSPQKGKRYLTKLNKELHAYRCTGNAEHLINVANYCWLEMEAPEHNSFHFDPSVGSVTRDKP